LHHFIGRELKIPTPKSKQKYWIREGQNIDEEGFSVGSFNVAVIPEL
jgi:hypothetical protein